MRMHHAVPPLPHGISGTAAKNRKAPRRRPSRRIGNRPPALRHNTAAGALRTRRSHRRGL